MAACDECRFEGRCKCCDPGYHAERAQSTPCTPNPSPDPPHFPSSHQCGGTPRLTVAALLADVFHPHRLLAPPPISPYPSASIHVEQHQVQRPSPLLV